MLKLNVGGQKFMISKTTLSEFPTFILNKMFFDFVLNDSPKKEIFIDRDGKLFFHIVEFLRTKSISIMDRQELERLYKEADYFMLPDLCAVITQQLNDQKLHTGTFQNVRKTRTIRRSCRNCNQYQLFSQNNQYWNTGNNNHEDCKCFTIEEDIFLQEWTCCKKANPLDPLCETQNYNS